MKKLFLIIMATVLFSTLFSQNQAKEISITDVDPNNMTTTEACEGGTLEFYAEWNGNLSEYWVHVLVYDENGSQIESLAQFEQWTSESYTITLNNVPAGISKVRLKVEDPDDFYNTDGYEWTNISVNSTPNFSGSISGNSNPCPNTSQTYSISSIGDENYIWSLPNGWTGSSNSNSIDVTVGGPYQGGEISVSVSNNCGSDESTLSVNIREPLAITDHPEDVNAGEGSSVVLSVAASGNQLNYQWYKDGNALSDDNQNISGSQMRFLNISNISESDAGEYHAVITDLSCGGSVTSNTATLNVATVQSEAISQNGISIYPNPTNGNAKIELTDLNVQKLSLRDVSGKQLLRKDDISQTQKIDLSGFEDGVYIISIQTKNSVYTQKIIKK